MKSAIAILTFRRIAAITAMMKGIEQHCPQYSCGIFEDCGQRDNTADVLQLYREPKPRPELMAMEYEPNPVMSAPCNFPGAQVFMGTKNLGVAANSNRALKWFMDGNWDHLCLCNDDLFVDGDFVQFYAKAHTDLDIGMFCFCVSGDTPLITKKGVVLIQNVVGKEIDIWNGKRWSRVVPKLTRKNARLCRVRLSDGSYLDCTPDHNFSTKTRTETAYVKCSASALLAGKHTRQCESTVVASAGSEHVREAEAYTLGFTVGDGHWAKVKNKVGTVYNYSHLYLYGEKKLCPVEGPRYPEKNRIRVIVNIEPEKVQALKDHASALDSLFLWRADSIRYFIAGLADADGSNTTGGGIRITIADERRALKFQLLLTSIGIRSSVGLDRRAGTATHLGTLSRDSYFVQITDCATIPCRRLNVRRGHLPRFKSKYQTVRSVEDLAGLHDVYCFTETEAHKGLFANVLTYQCDFTQQSPAISGPAESYKWTVYPWRGYKLKFLPRFTGIMISVTRALVEKIGFFDAIFGKFGEEHPCPPESLVWMGDYTFKPIGGIKVGDTVIGWQKRQAPAKRYGNEAGTQKGNFLCDTLQKSTVLAVIRLEKPLIEVQFASGRTIRCAPEHTWLNYHGVKAGNKAYIPAEIGKALVHVIEPQISLEPTLSYTNGYVHGLVAGDGGIDHGATVQRTTSKIILERLHRSLGNLGISFTTTQWDYAAVKPAKRRFTDKSRVLTVTRLKVDTDYIAWKPSTKEEWRGWLAGIYDADGYGRSFGQCPFSHPDVYDRIVEGLSIFGFKTTRQKHQIYLKGGWREQIRFWNICLPSLSYKLDDSVLLGRFKTKDKIERIVELSGRHVVYCLKTSTGNYVIQGYASKNCDYTIRARMAGGIRLNGQDMNCLDIEMPESLLRHQDVPTSMSGGLRKQADHEAAAIMRDVGRNYVHKHYHRPFRLMLPRNAAGYSGGGIPVDKLLDHGYTLVSDVQQ